MPQKSITILKTSTANAVPCNTEVCEYAEICAHRLYDVKNLIQVRRVELRLLVAQYLRSLVVLDWHFGQVSNALRDCREQGIRVFVQARLLLFSVLQRLDFTTFHYIISPPHSSFQVCSALDITHLSTGLVKHTEATHYCV